MCILTYRLIGDVNNPVLTKEFKTREDMVDWGKSCGNIIILTTTLSGAESYGRVYGRI